MITATIPLLGKYRGVAIVDAADMPKLCDLRWYLRPDGYINAKAGRPRTTYYMHRVIMDASEGVQVDHANGDKLDNRRMNLRLCTQSENCANRPPRGGRYKGVEPYVKRGRWRARLCLRMGASISLGYYDTPEEAALAYDRAAQQHFGEFASLNFPRGAQ